MDKYQVLRKKLVNEFGLPSWIERPCCMCESHMTIQCLTDIGVDLSRKNFGNITFGMFCESCGALEEYVAKTECLSVGDFEDRINLETVEIVDREESVTSSENNLVNIKNGGKMLYKTNRTIGHVTKLCTSDCEEDHDDKLVCRCSSCKYKDDRPLGLFCPKCGNKMDNYHCDEDPLEKEEDEDLEQ